MRIDPRLAAAMLALTGVAVPARSAPAPAVAQPTPEMVKAAERTLGVIVSALKAPNIPMETKGGLFGCLYQHPLGDISARMTKVLETNKQIDGNDPTQSLLVIAKICGAPMPAADPKSGTPAKPGR